MSHTPRRITQGKAKQGQERAHKRAQESTKAARAQQQKKKRVRVRYAAPPRDPEGPRTLEEFRRELFQDMCDIQSTWKQCPSAICRRLRACRDERRVCYTPVELPEKTRAFARFDMSRMLDAELARRAREGEG